MSARSEAPRSGWSIAEVARLSGVTARTLRHYDAIGLLPPARVEANGYRYYEREQLLRLQQILVLRELGLGLPTIAGVLAGEQDEIAALRRHHQRLLAERDRLERLADTVARTLARLEGGEDVDADEMFEGFRFTADKWERIKTESMAHENPEAHRLLAEAEQAIAGWTPAQAREAEYQAAQIETRLLDLMRDGAGPDDPRVHAILDVDYALHGRIYPPDKHTYAELGRAFAASPELREHLDARDPRLAEFMRDAMVTYAEAL